MLHHSNIAGSRKSNSRIRRSGAVNSLMQMFALGFAFALLHSSPVNATIHTVNCVAGPFFTISAAVGASVNGDTIMVEACAAGPYVENVTITGFTSLHVVGVTPPNAAGGIGDFGAKSAGVGTAVNSQTTISGAGLGGACFSIEVSVDVKVQNFSMSNCAQAGVRIRSSRQVLVLANRILNVPDGAAGVHAINTDDLQISSNLVAFVSQVGVLLDDTRVTTVDDNFIFRAGTVGIQLNDGANNRIDNNDVRNSGAQGLVVSGAEARIERNSFTQSGAADILVSAGSINADVVGNSVPGAINDAGFGTELASNF